MLIQGSAHDSHASFGEETQERLRFLRDPGGGFLDTVGVVEQPVGCGRSCSQFGTGIGVVSRKTKRAGRSSGVRRVKNCWALRKVMKMGKPHLEARPKL